MRLLIVSLAVLIALPALAEEKKPEEKKAPTKKTAAKSDKDKNVFQKAESSTGKFLKDSKIWTGSEPRSR